MTGEIGARWIFADRGADFAGMPGRLGPPPGCLALVWRDGAPVGCVGCVGFRDLGGGTMEIERMVVRPEAWGRGVGGAMLDTLLAAARAAGHKRFTLSTHRDRCAAQALHACKGVRVVPASEEFPGVEPEITLCMAVTPDATDGAAP